jgi:hypothetical protein
MLRAMGVGRLDLFLSFFRGWMMLQFVWLRLFS